MSNTDCQHDLSELGVSAVFPFALGRLLSTLLLPLGQFAPLLLVFVWHHIPENSSRSQQTTT